MAQKHDIMFEILRKSNAFDPIRDLETSDIILILLSIIFSCPCNYYKDCKWCCDFTIYANETLVHWFIYYYRCDNYVAK